MSDPDFIQACWLMKNGIAFDTAWALVHGGPEGEGEALAYGIAFGQLEGGDWDWATMSWKQA